ncbi:MAG: hypothetical protein KF768_06970 [Phycisphaeraceae bacterium]|nr:hypothetical protein [Phycisphaeraceae bacterium]
MNALIRGIVGAGIGGIVGAAVWAAISYFTNFEIGWIAVGVGFLCGLGMAVGSQGATGHLGGIVAAVIALASIAAGKYASVHFAAEDILQQVRSKQFDFSLDDARIYMCDQLCEEAESQGRTLRWPAGYSVENAEEQSHYPPEIWKDMESRWSRMSADDRENYRAATQASLSAMFDESIEAFGSQAKMEGFFASFDLFDLLWAALAIGAAFKVGSSDGTPDGD